MTRETVIGLEVHVQLLTRTKIFCACANVFGDPPNTHVCPVCLGLPGALPVLNAAAVDLAVTTALALGADVAESSLFARKHYFYPDLPKGYQISQYTRPLATGGAVPIEVEGECCEVALVRIHLEEDAGKLMHAEGGAGAPEGIPVERSRPGAPGGTRVDLNRCGVPLLEIVSRPQMRRPEEAGAFLESLRRIIRYLGVSDGDMSRGSLRCDANVSVRSDRAATPGTKTEIKNLNSIKAVEKAIGAEARRQAEILDAGGEVEPVTLLWDEAAQTVRAMRSKEYAHDYRYFPEPDLPPLAVHPERRERLRAALPELPFARRDRFVSRYGLSEGDAAVLAGSRPLADWFEELAAAAGDAKAAADWTRGEVMHALHERGGPIERFPVAPAALAELIALVKDGTVSSSAAKRAFARMLESGKRARVVVEEEALAQISDRDAVAAFVERVIAEHPEQAASFRSGREPVGEFLLGQVMRMSGGKANPSLARELLRRRLTGRGPT